MHWLAIESPPKSCMSVGWLVIAAAAHGHSREAACLREPLGGAGLTRLHIAVQSFLPGAPAVILGGYPRSMNRLSVCLYVRTSARIERVRRPRLAKVWLYQRFAGSLLGERPCRLCLYICRRFFSI